MGPEEVLQDAVQLAYIGLRCHDVLEYVIMTGLQRTGQCTARCMYDTMGYYGVDMAGLAWKG